MARCNRDFSIQTILDFFKVIRVSHSRASKDESSVTPRDLGYCMPAEWAPHRATWLSWPNNRETWPTQLDRVRDIWIRMIAALAVHEGVMLLVGDDADRQEVTNRLRVAAAVLENVTILQIPTVDVWMRDYGPTFVVREQAEAPLALNDWIFNGWGGKYRSYERDDDVAPAIAQILRLPVFSHRVVLEGGSIEVNGAGTCVTTEQCLLNKNRNPELNRSDLERFLRAALGIDHVIWLGDGIVGDDTDGHIDDIARFTSETTMICMVEENPQDQNYRPLKDNVERLKEARDAQGRKLNVVTIPSPEPIYCEGVRLPASYANFYIANETVLVPIFNDANDGRALGVLQELFPRRKVVGLDCTDVVAGLGAIHCVTQQEPSVLSSGA